MSQSINLPRNKRLQKNPEMLRRLREKKPLALARLIKQITQPALRRRGFAEAEVILRWPVIVGSEFEFMASPEKLVFPKNSPAGGTLYVTVKGSLATELQHRAPQIIDRINTYYGYRAVANLRLLQIPKNSPSSSMIQTDKVKNPPSPISAENQSKIKNIKHTRLREALQRLQVAISNRPTKIE